MPIAGTPSLASSRNSAFILISPPVTVGRQPPSAHSGAGIGCWSARWTTLSNSARTSRPCSGQLLVCAHHAANRFSVSSYVAAASANSVLTELEWLAMASSAIVRMRSGYSSAYAEPRCAP